MIALTDDEINTMWDGSFVGSDPTSGNQRFKFARAIESKMQANQITPPDGWNDAVMTAQYCMPETTTEAMFREAIIDMDAAIKWKTK